MARFVFRFVFSTDTCFQQLLRFVFRFVFEARSFVFNNLSGSVLKKVFFFVFVNYQNSPSGPHESATEFRLLTHSSPLPEVALLCCLREEPQAARACATGHHTA